jgi:transcriptional regulator with XRE-family HTH domain
VVSQPPENFVEKFAQVIRAERERLGLSQKKLAEIAGVARTGIVTLEQGKRVPSIYIAKALANALGTDLSALVGRAEGIARSAVPRKG